MADPEDLFDPRIMMGGDEGKTEMVIFSHQGRIILRYREPRLWVGFDAPSAVDVGKKLIDCAVECGANVQIQLPKRPPLSPAKRLALVTRATHIFRSMTEKGRAPKEVATHVVDQILSAVD